MAVIDQNRAEKPLQVRTTIGGGCRRISQLRFACAVVIAGLAAQAASAAPISWSTTPAVNNDTNVTWTSGSLITIQSAASYAVGDLIQFYGTSASSNPFNTRVTNYYVVSVNTTTKQIQVSGTAGGSAVAVVNPSSSSGTTYQFQDWNTTANWTGGVVPNTNTAIASFSSGLKANSPGVAVNADIKISGLSTGAGGSSTTNNLTFVSGANVKNLYTLTFQTNDSTTPMVTQGANTFKPLQFGQAGGIALAIGGNQGLIINGQAGGAIAAGTSGLTATSALSPQRVAFNGINYTNFSGGLIVQQGELGLQLNTSMGSGTSAQDVTVGNAATLTANKLAGLSLGFSQTIQKLNGNNLGRVWSQSGPLTLTVGTNNVTGGDFGGVIGTDFTGGTPGGTLNFIKIGTGVQTISGNIVGIGSVSANGAGGNLILSGINSYTGGTAVSAGTLSLSDDAQLKFVLGDTGVNNGITVSSGATLSLAGDFNIDTSNAVTSLGNAWTLVGNSGTANYLSTFTLLGFTEAADNVSWTKAIDASRQFLFTDSTGVLSVVAVPEPASIALLGLGGIGMLRRRNRKVTA